MKIKYIFIILGLLLAIFMTGASAGYVITLSDKSSDGTRIVKYVNSKALDVDRRMVRKKNRKNNGVYLYYRSGNSIKANYIPSELTYDNRVFKKLNPRYITYYSRGLSSRGKGRGTHTIDISKVIEDEAKKNNVDPLLIYLIMKYESNFNNYAVSRSGAMGLMQLMPGTAKMLGVSNAYNPYQNVSAGTSYFCTQLSNFGDLKNALAAYNAGPNKVKQ
ncbi:MAG: lytic transglycosylase domain-containing protein, partial [Candidatus Eremiobacteraeota bacterium]|nr:lytic transglycosylase domain-containing protein [Candidatus Eremiobacteraeota bacterium]